LNETIRVIETIAIKIKSVKSVLVIATIE